MPPRVAFNMCGRCYYTRVFCFECGAAAEVPRDVCGSWRDRHRCPCEAYWVALALGYNKKSIRGESLIEMYCQACIRQPSVMHRLGAVYDAREVVAKQEKHGKTVMAKIREKLCGGCMDWTRNYRDEMMLTMQPVGEAEAHNNLRDMQEEIMATATAAAAR